MATRTPRVKFYLEKRIDKKSGELIDKNVPIRFSLSYGNRYMSFTGHRIDKNLWDKGRVKPSHSHASQINKSLSDLKKELEDICYQAWDKNITITNRYISSNLKKNQESDKGFFEHMDTFIELGKKKWQSGTVTKFTTMKNHLQDMAKEYRLRIGYDGLDADFFERLLDYYFDPKRDYINSYVRKNIKFITQFLTWATKMGYNRNLQFKDWKLETGNKKESVKNKAIALTNAEFRKLWNMKLNNESKKRTRDFLILACSTGLRFSDLQALKKSDIDFTQGLITCTTKKTGDDAVIPLNVFSRTILERYRHLPNLNSKGVEMAFPTISNQKTNKALKELAKEAGINQMITVVHYQRNQRIDDVKPKYELISSHIGRKTYVTLLVWMGIEAEVIMGLTTHKSHETLENYYDVNLDMKRQAMQKFNPKVLFAGLGKSKN
jgi:integrase